uniref:Uncharacterized protein n=1 Tax=Rhizophora mucronata TaxID=61149 RepID=A0A2P2QMY8_RHIMU
MNQLQQLQQNNSSSCSLFPWAATYKAQH